MRRLLSSSESPDDMDLRVLGLLASGSGRPVGSWRDSPSIDADDADASVALTWAVPSWGDEHPGPVLLAFTDAASDVLSPVVLGKNSGGVHPVTMLRGVHPVLPSRLFGPGPSANAASATACACCAASCALVCWNFDFPASDAFASSCNGWSGF